MARVAAAIEEASVREVGRELWWDSHALLFETLDKNVAGNSTLSSGNEGQSSFDSKSQEQQESDSVLAEKLHANHQWLLNTVTCFKPPSAISRAALNSARMIIGSHTLEITPKVRDLALQVSSHLVLDEIQAFSLTSRVCGTKQVSSSFSDNALLSAIVMTYYMERQSLLKSTRLLLTCQMAEEDTTPRSSQTISEEVKKLLEDGLEEKMLEVLKESLSASQPRHLNREYGDLWAEQAALELTLLLDILFLLYYEPLCACKFTRVMELITIFEDLIIGRNRGEVLALTALAEKSLKLARCQAVLIIIEALDLESLLLMVHNETPLSQGGYALSLEELRQLDVLIGGLDLESAAECAPVLLSWAIFLGLVSFLPMADGEAALADFGHTVYVRQAYEAGACNFLLDMLRDEFFREFDIQVGGYKSVIKTLMAAFLAAYDSAGQMGVDGHYVVIDILCELYHGQEALCLELWDCESAIDGPIRNLLFSLRDTFPYDSLSLVRLLAAQCKGKWAAECVYDFLYRMVEVTCWYQCDELSWTDNSGNLVQTRRTLQVPDAPGLLIPAGTSGSILRNLAGGLYLVRWECKHSGIMVLLVQMLQRSINSYHMEEVLAIVNLINCMLSSNKGLTQLLLDLDGSAAAVTARGSGLMENSLRLDIVTMICSVINASVQNTGDDFMIASCIGILSTFALCCPEQVMIELSRSILLQPSGTYLSFSDGKAFPGSQLHELIVKTEQTNGYYPLTIAILDFSRTMIEKGTAASTNFFASFIMHVVGNLFVNHGNWKYQEWHERWMITTKTISIMQSVVSDITRTQEVSYLKGVLELLLYDCVVHDVLVNVLSVNGQDLEELYFNCGVGIKEIEWLQRAIYSVLMLLHDLVLDVTIGVCSKEYIGMKLLEQTLFRKVTGSLPVVTAIASFLSFSRNADLQFASAKALTSLFLLAQKSRPNPSGIASYISGHDQKVVMRNALRELLSEDTAFSDFRLFEAIIDLLTAAVRWQPALVELLLFPMDNATVVSKTSNKSVGVPTGADVGTSGNSAWVTDGLDALWAYVTKSTVIIQSHPQVLSRVLFLLASIWESGLEYLCIIDSLRSKPDFWKHLTSSLSFCNSSSTYPLTLMSKIKAALDPGRPIFSSLNSSELVGYSFLYTCEASVLLIMARDIFLQQHLCMGISSSTTAGVSESWSLKKDNNGAGKSGGVNSKLKNAGVVSGAVQIVLEWCKESQLSTITTSYALCMYETEILLRAKAEARVLVVGLMGKILSNDSRGLNVSLARRVKEAVRQIYQHPSFEELSEQYSTRGYSYGEQLQIMLIGDLFQHLQGELDGGRPVPSGCFQHVAGFLISNEVEMVLNPTVSTQLPDLHPSYGETFVYNTVAMETELGLEWWGHADFGIVTASVAESALRWTRHSNAMASLGHSQLSALRSWSALMTVSISMETEGGRRFSDADWTEPKLKIFGAELCQALEGSSDVATKFTPSFVTSQVQLLLVFIRLLSSHDTSSAKKIYVWSISAKVFHTVVNCLKKLLDTQCYQQVQIRELVKSFLGSLLLILELVVSQQSLLNGVLGPGESMDEGIREALADITLVGLDFLPSLCNAVETHDYANMAVGVINVLIKSFLSPSTWFPVLQTHFPLAACLSRMKEDTQGADSSKIMLNFCLSFVRLKAGAELLHSAGFFSQLQILSQQLEEVSVPQEDAEGPFSVWWKNSKQHGGLWSLGVAVVAGLVRSLGDRDTSGTVLQNAMTFIQLQKDRMVGALRAPTPTMDFQGRKKAKLQQPRTTLSALQDSQHVMALMCEVSHRHFPWTLQDSISDFGEVVVHLLAFIAREGLVRPGSSIHSGTGTGLNCQPLLKDEIAANSRPALVNCSCAWFAVTARGCAAENTDGTHSESPSRSKSQALTTSSSRRTGSLSSSHNTLASGGSSRVCASEYSNMVAIHIYKLTFLLLRYVCQHAHHAAGRAQDCGLPDYTHFPELPAPEILHGLQDQVVAVVTELCGKVPDRPTRDVCLMLLSVLEMTLYLEVCISKTCGVGPLPFRSDDFGKDYKGMLLAAYQHSYLETSLQSLKQIMATVHAAIK